MRELKIITMTTSANWPEQKEKLKARFLTLTDNDLLEGAGGKEETLARLQKRLGKTREELAAIIAAL